MIFGSTDKFRAIANDDGNYVYTLADEATPTGAWHMWASVWSGGNDMKIYRNATNLATTVVTATTPAAYTEWGVNDYESIGALQNGVSSSLANAPVRVDELRISDTNRSDAWLKANYNNQFNTSGFLTWGSIIDL